MTKSTEPQSSQGGVKRFTFTQPGRTNPSSGDDVFEGGDWSFAASSRPSNCNLDNSAFQLSDVWNLQHLNVDQVVHRSDGHNNYANRQYYSRHGGLSESGFDANVKHPLTTKHAPAIDESKSSWKRPTGHGFSYSLNKEEAKPMASERRGMNEKPRQGSMGNIQSTGLMKGGLYNMELQKSRRF